MLALVAAVSLAVTLDRLPPPALETILAAAGDRRADHLEHLAEVEALAALLQRLHFTDQEIEETGERSKFLAVITDGQSRGVQVAPFYTAKTNMRVMLVPVPGKTQLALEVLWEDRDRKAHRVRVRIDPAARRAAFENSRRLPQDAAFRLVFPNRVQVSVGYTASGVRVRVFNGPAARQFAFSTAGELTAADRAVVPVEDAYGEQLAVLALTDDTLRFVLPGDDSTAGPAANEQDRHFVRTWTRWQARTDGTRLREQRAVIATYLAFDAVDGESRTANPAHETRSVDARRARMADLHRALDGLNVQTMRLSLDLILLSLDEGALARRLRAVRQTDWLARAGAFDAETAPAPRTPDSLPRFLPRAKE